MRLPILPVLLVLCFGFSSSTYAQYVASDTAHTPMSPPTYKQEKKPSEFWQKVRFGGNFGAAFNNNATYLEVSPLAIYNVNSKLQMGPGISYIYNSFTTINGTFTVSQYGGRFFSRYTVYDNIFAHGELEVMNIGVNNSENKGRYTIVNPLLGGGYFQSFGGRGGAFVTLLYNFNHNPYLSPYPSPFIFRVGFSL